jgi:methylenetetrahydrofolate dehydrogenase (NADP+)/methenyltetrahydrofolate cyclohydrolase
MSSVIMDGKELAQNLKNQIANWIKNADFTPSLAIITIGDDDASKVYVKNKMKAAEEVGITAHHIIINYEQYHDAELFVNVQRIIDEHDGVILQLPVAEWCDPALILDQIPYEKDVDGLTIYQQGLLREDASEAFIPCTPEGIIRLVNTYRPRHLKRGNALVIGRSALVGRPVAELLLQDDWTVTICHSKTPKSELLRAFANADLVVSAVGKRNLITENDAEQYRQDNCHDTLGDFNFKQNRMIIDVGINRDENGKLCGDLSEEFKQKYGAWYTPVPGGVGPMTVAMLMLNTYVAAARRQP